MKQTSIKDFFTTSEDIAREDFYSEWDAYAVSTEIEKPLPSIDLYRRRFGKKAVSVYRALLEQAEEANVSYTIDRSMNLNSKTCTSRVRQITNSLDEIGVEY